MTNYQILLNLGKGNYQEGYPTVIAQLWEQDSSTPLQFTGSLPSAEKLINLYQRWQKLYNAIYVNLGLRNYQEEKKLISNKLDFEIEEDDITNISSLEIAQISQELKEAVNSWLDTPEFRQIERQIRTNLQVEQKILVIITAEDEKILKLPWHLWQFFEDYINAEFCLFPSNYKRSPKIDFLPTQNQVKILAIFGDSEGINLEEDKKILQQLPQAEIKFLVEPSPQELNEQLWDNRWDVLFFAGHSITETEGKIKINSKESLTLEQLKFGLKKVITKGLKLAIFNSCDGLGLGWKLADLSIPQVIVMREPVANQVAAEFLRYFLKAFSDGLYLYQAVREAREKLQYREQEFPCASWLPTIFQNPAEAPLTWENLVSASSKKSYQKPLLKRHQLLKLGLNIGINSLIITSVIVAARFLGILEPLELKVFDEIIKLRPKEQPDSRLLIIEITENDIQEQEDYKRSSLSDKNLDKLLNILEKSQAKVIGLDIYRDFAVESEYPQLAKLLQKSDRIIATCKSSDANIDRTGIAPPPEIPLTRIGFSDFIEDNDGILRRQLLFLNPEPASVCQASYGFATQLAFRYLYDLEIIPEFTPEGNLKLDNTIFPSLKKSSGFYQNIDARGSQIIINYRALSSHREIAPHVTLKQVLNNQVTPQAIKDKIIIIGVTANSSSDYWSTPYGINWSKKSPGVFIQAQMVSQILSAVLDKRPLIWFFSWREEFLLIFIFSVIGVILAVVIIKPIYFILAQIGAIALLIILSLILLIQGGAFPIIPTFFGFILTEIKIKYTNLIKK